ncbi:MAG: FoF1 ATP synthase subunit gamma, partial [Coprococcus sp.]
MANTKEIQNRIKSISDTMKITNAMYMISSSKLKKAKTDLENTEPYFYTLQVALARVLRHMPEMEHLYFDSRDNIKEEEKRRGYIVVTADKGMAGAYNHNVIKIAEKELAVHPNSELYVVGQVGRHYFAKRGVPVDIHFQYTAQNPSMHRARVIADKMLEYYENGDIDEVYIIYTNMKSSVQADAEMIRLLPLEKKDLGIISAGVFQEEIVMEPSPKAIL